MIFKWLKNKFSKRTNSEMNGCIVQNLNFVNMIEVEEYVFKRNIDNQILEKIYEIKEKTGNYKKIKKIDSNFTPNETNDLLEMNMHCRNIWKNYFNKKPLEFDKEFSSDKIEIN